MFFKQIILHLNWVVSRLAVPESLKNLYKDDKDNVHDQQDSHNGRIRSFAHERGNWATYVFIPGNLPKFSYDLITSSIKRIIYVSVNAYLLYNFATYV